MGQPDQFAKRTFASDAAEVTHGGVAWEAAPEIGLVSVQVDGLLRVMDEARLAGLADPWEAARPHTEIYEDEARIEGCTDLAALERWHEEAVTAASAAEALR
jgi:hypothetical protein